MQEHKTEAVMTHSSVIVVSLLSVFGWLLNTPELSTDLQVKLNTKASSLCLYAHKMPTFLETSVHERVVL